MKISLFLNASLLFFLISCNNTSFVGNSSKKNNKPISDKVDEVVLDVASNKVDYSDFDEITKTLVQNISATVVAKDLLNAAYLPAPNDKITARFQEGSQVPPGAKIDDNAASLVWQSDLQDIGLTVEGKIGVSLVGAEDGAKDVTYLVNVIPPAVDTVVCSYTPEPVIGDIKPEEKWHWPGVTFNNNTYSVTFSSPVAGDIDHDGVVEVVGIASTTAYYGGNGALVVLNGETGLLLWNLLESGIAAEASTTPALMDLDGDGTAEIIAVVIEGLARAVEIIDYKQKKVRTFYREGFLCGPTCMVAVGDIDVDGKPEIVAGNVILDSTGTRKAYLGANEHEPPPTLVYRNISTLADLVPNSPGLEVIANGSTVYSDTGKFLWKGSCGGYSAVADLEHDGMPELVCIGANKVYVYEANGTERWEKSIPNNGFVGNGGAPNIGDFNGDGKFEIGTAAGDYYVVYDAIGTELWKMPTADRSSSSTGSTLFDFNGDGKVEVVYNDEQKLRIYDGASGTVLWEEANASCTLWEFPIIVNLDQNSSVEIVVASPASLGCTNDINNKGGFRAFFDPAHHWVTSRNLWNQYSYYPELVSDQLTAVINPGLPKEGFRVNKQTSLKKEGQILLPDLQAVDPLFPGKAMAVTSGGNPRTSLTAFIKNQGQADITTSIKVDLLDGTSETLLKTAVISDGLKSGMGKIVTFDFTEEISSLGPYKIKVNLDQDNVSLSHECNTKNNTLIFNLRSLERSTE